MQTKIPGKAVTISTSQASRFRCHLSLRISGKEHAAILVNSLNFLLSSPSQKKVLQLQLICFQIDIFVLISSRQSGTKKKRQEN